jgi:hypothetical protein
MALRVAGPMPPDYDIDGTATEHRGPPEQLER